MNPTDLINSLGVTLSPSFYQSFGQPSYLCNNDNPHKKSLTAPVTQ